MNAYATELKVLGSVGILLLLYVFVWRHGYTRGVEDKVAYYEPILRQAADDKIAADSRATAAESRAVQITSDVEQAHADLEKTLSDRATGAEQRIAVLLRERATATPHGRGKVPPVSGSASERPSPAPSDERDDRLAASVSSVGEQCEHDARELAEWQQWYERQRASLTAN